MANIKYEEWKNKKTEEFDTDDMWWIKKDSNVQETGSWPNVDDYLKSEEKISEASDYDDDRWTVPARSNRLEKKKEEREKKPKEKPPRKVFNVGDIIILIKKEQKKLPNDAYEFLLTYSKFEVKAVNENGNLYLGFDRNGEEFWFAPNRFELKPLDKPKPIEKDPFDFEDED